MPGAYAHITAVNVARETAALEAARLDAAAIASVLDYLKYCELGALSPDYPYLDLVHRGQKAWADAMHYDRTGALIQAGVRRVAVMSGEQQRKCLAWLLGYAAHVTTDVTIHPVVEKKVGPYEGNKGAHRECEMHQDAYIFASRMNLGGVEYAEYLDSHITKCSSRIAPDRLDEDVAQLWVSMLTEVHPALARSEPPVPDDWHRGFRFGVDKIAESGRYLAPIARHVARGLSLTYPLASEVNRTYIDALATPTGAWMSYDEIFDKAVTNVRDQWRVVSEGVLRGDRAYVAIGDWDLDTGKDGVDYVYWKIA
jgi:hypothetical protein